MFCRVMDAVDDEIVAGASGGARGGGGGARQGRDAGRHRGASALTEAWKALIAFPDARVAVAATATRAGTWTGWTWGSSSKAASPATRWRARRANLGDALDADRRRGVRVLPGAGRQGQDHRTKTELIRGLGLVETCAQLSAVSANLNAPGYSGRRGSRCARATRRRRRARAGVLPPRGDAAACADPSEPHAPPPETLQTAAGLLDALMPVAVAHARAGRRAVAAALPLCSAYAHRLKAPGCAQPGKGKGERAR